MDARGVSANAREAILAAARKAAQAQGHSKTGATHVRCSNARNKGEAVCTNRRTIKLADLEGRVLAALRERLMLADAYAAFVRGFMVEWNAEQKERAVAQEGQRQELKRLARKIGDLVASSADSVGSAAILTALTEAEACQALLQAELAVAEPA